MPGCAFSIEEALIASRWAEQILPRGYRVVITPNYRNADEIIEVYSPASKTPAFRVSRTARSFFTTDCIGLALSFPTLGDALLAMVPLSKSGRQAMLKGASPAWLPTYPTRPAKRTAGLWSRMGKSVLEAARTWTLRRELD